MIGVGRVVSGADRIAANTAAHQAAARARTHAAAQAARGARRSARSAGRPFVGFPNAAPRRMPDRAPAIPRTRTPAIPNRQTGQTLAVPTIVSPPGRNPRTAADRGRQAANWVKNQPMHRKVLAGGAALTAASVVNSSGRPTDKTQGRPTGMYGY